MLVLSCILFGIVFLLVFVPHRYYYIEPIDDGIH